MKVAKLSIAALLCVGCLAANATVVGGVGGNTDAGTFVSLSSADVVGTLFDAGYSIPGLTTSPIDAVGKYLSAAPAPGTDAIFFVPPTGTGSSYVSFDWGTIDSYNTVLVFDAAGGVSSFTASSLGLATGTDSYVNFTSTGPAIVSLAFQSSTNAFEAANFSLTAVPEPSSSVLILAGLGAFGLLYRKRRV